MRRWIAELTGTFILVFAGTGAIIIDHASGGAIGHGGIALVFGLIVVALIHAFGEVSGAHLNPAVTFGFALAGRFAWSEVAGFVVAQMTGAFAASALLRGLFPEDPTLGATLPVGPVWRSFVLEIVLAAILMMVISGVSTGSKEKGAVAGIAVGATVAAEAMFAGPVSGASMNPARSLAPAILSGHFEALWLYPAAAFLGVALSVLLAGYLYPTRKSIP